MDIIWKAYLGETLLAFLMFVLGACLASFIYVVVYRYLVAVKGRERVEVDKSEKNAEKTEDIFWKNFIKEVLFGRSYCDKCKRTLEFKELIPVINIFFTGGKCKKCGYKVPIKYITAEIFLGTIFLILFLARGALFDSTFQLILACIVTTAMFFFTLFDLEKRVVPDIFLLPIIGLIFVVALINAFITGNFLSLVEGLIAALAGFGFIYIIILTTVGKGFGIGDAKYMVALGLLLGKYMIVVTYIAIILGAIIGLACFFLHKARKTQKVKFNTYSIPFIPFLSFGAFLMYIKGEEIFEFIRKFFTI